MHVEDCRLDSMMKRIHVIAVLMASAFTANIAHADTWVYHDTLPTDVLVYVNSDSIRVTQVSPEIRSVQISLGRSGSETEIRTVEVMCAPASIRTQNQRNFSATQPTQTMGRFVAKVCAK